MEVFLAFLDTVNIIESLPTKIGTRMSKKLAFRRLTDFKATESCE
jgi:hypothetical protein